MSFRSDGKDNPMKIKITYENTRQTLEVDRDEMWLSLSLGSTVGLTEDEMERRIQERFDEQFNRPDYNNWHRHNRHSTGTAMPKRLDGKGYVQATDDESDKPSGDTLDLFPDCSDEEGRNRSYDYEAVCSLLRSRMKPDQAELLIAVHINKVPKQEYAAKLGVTSSAISHRLETAEKNFKKIFPTSSSFRSSCG